MTTESVAPVSPAEVSPDASPAELRARLDVLGLSRQWLSQEWGVSEGTVRNWLSGASPIPSWVEADVQQIWDFTSEYLASLVKGLDMTRVLITYRNEKEYQLALGSGAKYSAQWHRHVCARAQLQVPDATIIYRWRHFERPGAQPHAQ